MVMNFTGNYGIPQLGFVDYNAINQNALLGTLMSNRGGGGGGGGGGAIGSYYNYLGDIYGADRQLDIANVGANANMDIAGMRGNADRDVANINAGASMYGDDTRYDIAGLQDATNRYGIDAQERLGNYRTQGDIYGAELGYDAAMGRNATDRYGHDVEKYGLDVGREVAGMRDAGETSRARIGASQGALGDILRDNRRGQVMSSPLLASMLGTNFQGLIGGAMGAMNGTPGAATAAAKNSQPSFSAPNPYDSNSTVASLLSQITGEGQPAVDYPRAGAFQQSEMPASERIAQRPDYPASSQSASSAPILAERRAAAPTPIGHQPLPSETRAAQAAAAAKGGGYQRPKAQIAGIPKRGTPPVIPPRPAMTQTPGGTLVAGGIGNAAIQRSNKAIPPVDMGTTVYGPNGRPLFAT